MAGIGFELRRVIDSRSGIVAKIKAYGSAGLISSGPWIVTMVTLLVVSVTGDQALCPRDSQLFRALVTYAFAFSLLTVGTVQMAFTRHVSDALDEHRYGQVLTSFIAALSITCVIQAASSLVFCHFAGFETRLSILFTSLYVVVSAIWLAVSWLTVIRQYNKILVAYLLGMVVSIVAMSLPGTGIESLLGAYTIGQALTLGLLIRLIIRGTDTGEKMNFAILRSARTYPDLIGVGLFYSAAIWVDKMVFWYRDGVTPTELIYFHPLYDTACFLAYLTVVPAMAVNLIHFETSFYEHHRAYYSAVLRGMPLREIEWRRAEMAESLRQGTARLLRMQGWITAAAILFAQPLLELLGLPDGAARVFRIASLGAFFHVLLMITILVQLYFDLRREACWCTALFFCTNGLFTWISMDLGAQYYGLGYTLAALLSLIVAFQVLCKAIDSLEYLTFARLTRDQASAADAN